MQNIYKTVSLLGVVFFILILSACKKDDNAPVNNNNTNNNTNPCNFTTSVLVIDATTKNILSDSCRVFGSNYFSEHWVDAAKTEGIVLIFDGAAAPATGTYTAVNTFAAIASGKVYVEYYDVTNAYQPASGTVTVSDNGSSKIYTFCNFSCTNGSTAKTISVRAECN